MDRLEVGGSSCDRAFRSCRSFTDETRSTNRPLVEAPGASQPVAWLVNAGCRRTSSGGRVGPCCLAVGRKLVGIVIAVVLSVVAGLRLPDRFSWRDLAVAGCASGKYRVHCRAVLRGRCVSAGPQRNDTKIGALLSISGGESRSWRHAAVWGALASEA